MSARMVDNSHDCMPVAMTREVTRLLLAWSNGDTSAFEKLAPIVTEELHRLAKQYMRRERAGHILQPTALVNEAYLRLVDAAHVEWQNRAHFFAVSAQIMRHILVDFARSRRNLKRGAGAQHVSLEDVAAVSGNSEEDLVAVDAALKRLEALDPRQSQVVELRFFGGLSLEETAEVLK